jgi:hypothetical protein
MKISVKQLRNLVREELSHSTKNLRRLNEDDEVIAAEEEVEVPQGEVELGGSEITGTLTDKEFKRYLRQIYASSPETERASADNRTNVTPGEIVLSTHEWDDEDGTGEYIEVDVYALTDGGNNTPVRGARMDETSDAMWKLFSNQKDTPEWAERVGRDIGRRSSRDWRDAFEAYVNAYKPMTIQLNAMAISDPEAFAVMMDEVYDSPLFQGVAN